MNGGHGLRDGGQGLAHSGMRSGNESGNLMGQRGLRGRQGPDLSGQAGVVERLRAPVHVVSRRGAAGRLRLRGRLRGLRGRGLLELLLLLLREGQLGGSGGGIVESSSGQRALYGRAAHCSGVGAGREDGGRLGGLRAGAGGVQVAVGQTGRCVHWRRLCPHAGGRSRGGRGGIQGCHLGIIDGSDRLHHLPVMLHYLLQDLVLLVVEHTRVQILLELLQKNGIFLACQRKKESHLESLQMTENEPRQDRSCKQKYAGVSPKRLQSQILTFRPNGKMALPFTLPVSLWEILPSMQVKSKSP